LNPKLVAHHDIRSGCQRWFGGKSAISISSTVMTVVGIALSETWQWNLNRCHHLNDIPQTHGVGKPAHGLLSVAATFGVAGLIIVSLGQQSQPAEATRLNNGEIKLGWLGVSDALAFLLHQKLKP